MNEEFTNESRESEVVEECRSAEIVVVTTSPDAADFNALYLRYLVLPAIFLTVTLLGGLRIAGDDGAC